MGRRLVATLALVGLTLAGCSAEPTQAPAPIAPAAPSPDTTTPLNASPSTAPTPSPSPALTTTTRPVTPAGPTPSAKACQHTEDTDIAVVDRLPNGTVYYQRLGAYFGGGCTPTRTYLSTVADGEHACVQAALAKDNPNFEERVDGPRQTLQRVQWTAGTC